MRYKLRMLCIQLEEKSVLVGDNMSVVVNNTSPSSALKKKHQTCRCHCVCEVIAAGYIKFNDIDTKINLADICTKPLPPYKFHQLLSKYINRKAEFTEKEKKKMRDKVKMKKNDFPTTEEELQNITMVLCYLYAYCCEITVQSQLSQAILC